MSELKTIRQVMCKLCKHKWFPRTAKKPRLCPNCHSTYWDEGRQRPPRQEQLQNAQQRREEQDKK